jgi:hypothetical protein
VVGFVLKILQKIIFLCHAIIMITKQERHERRQRHERCLRQYGLIISEAYLEHVAGKTSVRKQQQRQYQREEQQRLDSYDLILIERYDYMAWMKTMRKQCDTIRLREWCVTSVVALDTIRMTVEYIMGEWRYQHALDEIRGLAMLNQVSADDMREAFVYAHRLSGYRVGMSVAQKRARVAILSTRR